MGSQDKISRRSSIAGATGLLVVGSGLGVVLEATVARADGSEKFVLKIHKVVDGKKKAVGTIDLPDELLAKLAESGAGEIQVVLERGSDKKVLGKGKLSDAPKMRDAIKKSKKRAKKQP